jgi:outer membrane protein assembly factor BamD (BamD/ComL family)
VVWTPTVLISDPDGKERWRLEGYLTKDEGQTWLEMGLGRLAVMRKDWPAAERQFSTVIQSHSGSVYGPEAIYWQGVSRYSGTHDHTALGDTARTLADKYPKSQWAMRSLPWLPAGEAAA